MIIILSIVGGVVIFSIIIIIIVFLIKIHKNKFSSINLEKEFINKESEQTDQTNNYYSNENNIYF